VHTNTQAHARHAHECAHADTHTHTHTYRSLSLGGFGGTVIANPDANEDAPMADVVHALQNVPGLSNGHVVVAR